MTPHDPPTNADLIAEARDHQGKHSGGCWGPIICTTCADVMPCLPHRLATALEEAEGRQENLEDAVITGYLSATEACARIHTDRIVQKARAEAAEARVERLSGALKPLDHEWDEFPRDHDGCKPVTCAFTRAMEDARAALRDGEPRPSP